MTKKSENRRSLGEIVRIWITPAVLLAGLIYGAGSFSATDKVQAKDIAELKKDTKALKKIMNEQHVIQKVQAEQMKWILSSKKNER